MLISVKPDFNLSSSSEIHYASTAAITIHYARENICRSISLIRIKLKIVKTNSAQIRSNKIKQNTESDIPRREGNQRMDKGIEGDARKLRRRASGGLLQLRGNVAFRWIWTLLKSPTAISATHISCH